MFLLNIGYKGWPLGKDELTIFRNSAPTFVLTFWLKGGLNHVVCLDLCLFPEAPVVAVGSYFNLYIYTFFIYLFFGGGWFSLGCCNTLKKKFWCLMFYIYRLVYCVWCYVLCVLSNMFCVWFIFLCMMCYVLIMFYCKNPCMQIYPT